MKRPFQITLLTIALHIGATPLLAQITNSEGSAALLASHCAASSGNAAENYQSYGRKLALTLSMLTPEAQARVFGNYSAGAGISKAPTPAAESSPPSPLLDLVNQLNEALFGDDPVPEPIIGGNPPVIEIDETSKYAKKAAEYAAMAEDLKKTDPVLSAEYALKAAEYAQKAANKAAEDALYALTKASKDATDAVEDAKYEKNKAQDNLKDLEDDLKAYQQKSEDLALSDPDKAANYAAKAAEIAAEIPVAELALDAAKEAEKVAKEAEKVAWDNYDEAQIVADDLVKTAEDAVKDAEKAAEDAAKYLEDLAK